MSDASGEQAPGPGLTVTVTVMAGNDLFGKTSSDCLEAWSLMARVKDHSLPTARVRGQE